MTFDLAEWLSLALRWLHLTTGIAWIGASFYFVWLDLHLKPPAQGHASGEVWSVHGGGFYHKQKYVVAPAEMPEDLHWFKWEAYFTWMSGFSLLVLLYYWNAQTYLIDPAKANIHPGDAVCLGLLAIALGWIVYDALCSSRIGENNRLLGVCWFLYLLATAFVLNSVLSARGTYLHIGAILGTAMVGNVFFVIIPNQRRVVNDLIAGRTPDPALGKAAKQRSLHNNYMTLPVLFIMISHHYPMTYGADRPWLVLALLGLTGVAIRHVFNLRHVGAPNGRAMAVAGVMALVSVTYVSIEKIGQPQPAASPDAGTAAASGPPAYADIAPIFAKHCTMCHAPRPTHAGIPAAPLGVMLDSYPHASSVTARIKAMAVDTEAMPLGNETGMTKAERARIGAWIAGGAQP